MRIILNIFKGLFKGVIVLLLFLTKMTLAVPFTILAYLVAIGEGDVYKANENIFGKIADWFYGTADRIY